MCLTSGTNMVVDSIHLLESEVTMTTYDSFLALEQDFDQPYRGPGRWLGHVLVYSLRSRRVHADKMNLPRVFSCDSNENEVPEASHISTRSDPDLCPSRVRGKQMKQTNERWWSLWGPHWEGSSEGCKRAVHWEPLSKYKAAIFSLYREKLYLYVCSSLSIGVCWANQSLGTKSLIWYTVKVSFTLL